LPLEALACAEETPLLAFAPEPLAVEAEASATAAPLLAPLAALTPSTEPDVVLEPACPLATTAPEVLAALPVRLTLLLSLAVS